MEEKIFSVTELNDYIRRKFEEDSTLRRVIVKGEISNFTNHYRSGHLYLSLKDEGAIIRAVMFKSSAQKLIFEPESGMKVIVTARVSVFPRDGQYQLYISEMQPDGIGALHVKFEQLKAKLAAEGLFDETKKKKLPKMPLRIGVVTSPTGAAVRDIINILRRRFPAATVLLYPVLVQGPQAAPDISRAIAFLNEGRKCDVMIVGRGGGSLEELWAFNEEEVARAVAASEIPVISAVGHETDFTICDFCADLRAPTPSAAAELAVPSVAEIKKRMLNYNARVTKVMLSKIEHQRERVRGLARSRSLSSPRAYLEERRMRLLYVGRGITAAMNRRNGARRSAFGAMAAKLDALSPLAVMARGYSIATSGGAVLRSAAALAAGDEVELRFRDGSATCEVTGTTLE